MRYRLPVFLYVHMDSLTMFSWSLHPGSWTPTGNCYKYIDFCSLLQINIKLKSEMPVQIDGEPWMQAAGTVIVRPILTQVLLKGLWYLTYQLGIMEYLLVTSKTRISHTWVKVSHWVDWMACVGMGTKIISYFRKSTGRWWCREMTYWIYKMFFFASESKVLN